MVIEEAALAGAFALGGVALQQVLTMLSESRRSVRERAAGQQAEQHEAFVQLVTTGRRVQRALVDRSDPSQSHAAAGRLAAELDHLTEAAVVVRLIVRNDALLNAVEEFEHRAKRLEDQTASPGDRLQLTGLILAIQKFEERPKVDRGSRQ